MGPRPRISFTDICLKALKRMAAPVRFTLRLRATATIACMTEATSTSLKTPVAAVGSSLLSEIIDPRVRRTAAPRRSRDPACESQPSFQALAA